jgi:ATP-dependent Clp protease protease subunit
MSLCDLPQIQNFVRPDGLQSDTPSDALARFVDMPMAAVADDPSVISIFGDIGLDYWDDTGFTAQRCADALNALGPKPVTIEINSPGGDVFEGLAIYNLLREHPAKVTVKVMGLAASAASIIAMVGDEIIMGTGSFIMVHNAWVCACGNQNDLRRVLEMLEPIDAALAQIYATRTGASLETVQHLLDNETWLNAAEAVDQGFADNQTNDRVTEAHAQSRPFITARRRVEAALAGDGMPRAERRRMINDISSGTPGATVQAMPGAGLTETGLRQLINTIKN